MSFGERAGRGIFGTTVLPVICGCAMMGGVGLGEARADTSVVELFTSQGCSSCPPADKALGDLARDPDIVALSFSVDYWDYLGWKDSHARPEFTKRQHAYARARGDRSIFTPQAIVNGREALVGSREGEIRDAIAAMKGRNETPAVPVEARIVGDRVVIDVGAGKPAPDAHVALWIAGYLSPQTVVIGGGENRDRDVTYYHVVDRWQVLGIWDGAPMTVELPVSDIVQDKAGGLAVILQSKANGLPGPILGATRVDLSGGT